MVITFGNVYLGYKLPIYKLKGRQEVSLNQQTKPQLHKEEKNLQNKQETLDPTRNLNIRKQEK